MGLISKTVKVKWNATIKKYYEALGYIYTKMGDEFEVDIKDLQKGSNAKVKCICDNCGHNLNPSFNDYNKKIVKENGKTYCNKCARKLYGGENARKTKLKNSKSFYDWCLENNRQDILDRWDYDLNGCSPKDISYSTHRKMWFKCNRYSKHKSELKSVHHFVSGHEGCMDCKQCNSVAQYILDSFSNKKLEEVWDYEKNGDLDPWNISRGNGKKCWFICQEKDYHGSYKMGCNNFSLQHQRCPYCSNNHGKVHPLDSLGQYVIDNCGEEFLWKIWSDKNKKSPFEYTVGTQQKVWWNCPDEKHEEFLRGCANSVKYEFRCPKCVEEREESMYEEKTRLYLQELGYKVLTEHNCTIRPINPKTKRVLPLDNEIILENDKHLIIEVHGEQHYDTHLYETRYNCSNEEADKMLHQRKLYDRYKRIKCIQSGYEYLEIPYTAFDKKETYKKLIDNKIKEILDELD